jgi:hypothetical protein
MGVVHFIAAASLLAPSLALAKADPAKDPQAFVRETVEQERNAQQHPQPRWTYRLKKTNAAGTKLTQIIETPQGLVGRLLAINGKPLDPITEHNEESRLDGLRSDPKQMKQKLARQERDRQRVLNIVGALPNALLYYYEGTGEGPFGREVTLRFRPNPNYSPDSTESELLKAMSGRLRIAKDQQRLIQLRGHLDSDLSIGLGIIGKVYKGGTLDLQQAEIAPGAWAITRLRLAVTGRALFKPLDLSVDESMTDFHPLGGTLSVEQAVDRLLASSPAE